ncbi:hypothetical protein NAEGRDRAFT_63304 [Naegleria gruberi]|uniref:Dynein axonemal intermediate chain 4 n=1 Tax=Naegleria gruberi TaxID=5762 RepID=D2V3B9_NAEGR|nr:uncharacterized protein NAEGRDRAFT_63304 [Naegleria gruberi]EFC48744.1 hypothetical protein NAEGRDRAFT_63304 [Naegleria gruberi]|eukprot:XP_002681488.1 hypothetical protein NAEGRDRAFT_63304 [Naegleria gruberi strain NEG-M]
MSTQLNTGSSTSRTSKSRKSDSKKGFGKKNVGSSITLQGMKKRFQTMLGKTKDSFDAVDPVTKQIKNPAPLFSQNTSADMAGSYQSGNISPSSASESISDFDRASSYSFGRDIPQGEASQAGSSSPSVVSDDEESFVFSGPVGNDDTFSTAGSVDLSLAQDLDNIGAVDSFIKKSDVPSISLDRSNEEKLTEKQLEMLQEVDFTISLTETETFFLFDKFDESVKVDDPKIEEIREKNKVYKELLKNKENNRDNYMDKHVQTMEKFYKNKRTNTSKTEYEEVEVQVSAYQIFDDYKDIREREEREREEREIMTSLSNKQDEEDEEEGDLEDDGADDISVKSGRVGSEKTSVSSYQELVITRAVVQNIFHNRQKRYINADDRDVPLLPLPEEQSETKEVQEEVASKSPNDSQETPRSDTFEEEEVAKGEDEKEKEREDEEKDKAESDTEEDVVNTKPSGVLTTLWEYNCDVVKNYNVNNLTWNKQNNDILAAAYGSGDVTDLHQSNGVILCWNVKNPAYPERILKVDGAGVNSVNFSATNPSILAAGLSDGTVSIYDIRRKENTPVMETIKSHTGTVWDLKWVNRGKDVGEKLHSVGVDGRVNSWTIKKGLESSEIMRLKRIGRATDMGGDAMISRESGGMSIDFSPSDNLIYLVGTEDGAIFKCSSSYNEHPLETYIDHTGPVYSVRWNPVVPDMFISCSADWTVKIWNQESLTPIFTIESYSEKSDQRSYSVTDVAWSKYCSTMFATSSIVGDLELWDLSYSTVRPKYSKTKPGKLNCTIFAEDVPIVLVGDSKGSIEVLRAEDAEKSQESQLEKFLQ